MSSPTIFRSFKTSFYFIVSFLLASLVNRPVVLCFHRVGKSSGGLLDQRVGVTDPDSFEKVITYLRMLGYSFISLEHIINNITVSRLGRVAVITFDDGYKDLYENAYPILKSLNIPFTLFLTTSSVDAERLLWLHRLYIALDRLSPATRLETLKKYANLKNIEGGLSSSLDNIMNSNGINATEIMEMTSKIAKEAGLSEQEQRLYAKRLYLTKSELREMQRHGLSIEVHGHDHLPPANLTRIETEKEIGSSVSYVMQELNGMPKFYSLPYGMGNRFINDVVKDLKLGGIVTTEGRLLKGSESIYNLPRFCVTNENIHFYRRLVRNYGKAFLEKMHLMGSDC